MVYQLVCRKRRRVCHEAYAYCDYCCCVLGSCVNFLSGLLAASLVKLPTETVSAGTQAESIDSAEVIAARVPQFRNFSGSLQARQQSSISLELQRASLRF